MGWRETWGERDGVRGMGERDGVRGRGVRGWGERDGVREIMRGGC